MYLAILGLRFAEVRIGLYHDFTFRNEFGRIAHPLQVSILQCGTLAPDQLLVMFPRCSAGCPRLHLAISLGTELRPAIPTARVPAVNCLSNAEPEPANPSSGDRGNARLGSRVRAIIKKRNRSHAVRARCTAWAATSYPLVINPEITPSTSAAD